jgi:hypothetical protein
MDCYAVTSKLLVCAAGPQRSDTMNLTEIAVMTAVLASMAALRFGVPIVITWMVGKAAARFTHAA